MPETPNKKRAEQQVGRLTAHMRENDDLVNLIKGLSGASHQVIEDVYYDLRNKRHLGDAANAQLDVLGRHLITLRNGLTDENYTVLLNTRYNFFQRSGEPERLIELFQLLTGAYLIEYDDTYCEQCNSLTAHFTSLPVLEAVNQEKVVADMRKAKQAGQGLRLLLVLDPVFRFSADPDTEELDSDFGFDSGLFAEPIIEF